jgi:hypothetical protein
MDLEAYRRSAESFVSELTSTFYRHYSGLDERYEIEPIYERHASLFVADAVDSLRELTAAAAPEGEERRRLRMLLEFAVDGHLGQSTKELEAELARREATYSIVVDGEQIGYRESEVLQANEPDSEQRESIERARLDLTEEHLNPLYRELMGRQHECARTLGYASYRALCEECKGLDLEGLRAQTSAFSAATDDSYLDIMEPELERTLGFGLSEMRSSDLARFFRATVQDRHFPSGRLVPSLLETLAGLGISERDNVILDLEPRANKSPRAFCAPVRVPDEVYLVISPVGGRDDFSALFHEAGHTEHYAHVGPELPFEFRYLGDNAITEAFAFLFQHLVEDPLWLERRLGLTDTAQLASYARANRLIYLRRYAAKLAYEMELHGEDGSLDGRADRYAALLGGALGIRWPGETFLADVDPGFYCSCYLRAWALETHLRTYLRQQFGPAWFESPAAGLLIMELWREGQRRAPQELLGELTGESLDFGVLLVDLGLDGSPD